MVFACIGLVGTLIGVVVLLILPQDLFTLTLGFDLNLTTILVLVRNRT